MDVNKEYIIEVIHDNITLNELIPKFRYQFQNLQPNLQSEVDFSDLLEFLETNQDLLIHPDTINRQSYIQGFQTALAIIRLWIDSKNLEVGKAEKDI